MLTQRASVPSRVYSDTVLFKELAEILNHTTTSGRDESKLGDHEHDEKGDGK